MCSRASDTAEGGPDKLMQEVPGGNGRVSRRTEASEEELGGGRQD